MLGQFRYRKYFFFNVYLFICGREGQRERETEDLKQVCPVSTQPDAGLEPMNCEIMT